MCCNFYTFLCCSVGKMLLKNRRFGEGQLFHDKGLTNTEIAKELGYKNMSSIGYFLKEMGLKSNYDKNIKLRDRISK